MDLFEYQAKEKTRKLSPLAERMRPEKLSGFIGQSHVTGEQALIRHAVEQDKIFSMILWGPPGCGKTSLARIISKETGSFFARISAVLSGVKDIREVIETAKKQQGYYGKKTILFVDEIHRFNKGQQDAFLHHVENGLITLIGATTENPSFEVIAPLLSRCRVIKLNPLAEDAVEEIIYHAIEDRTNGLGKMNLEIEPEAVSLLARLADGDARNALNSLEIAAGMLESSQENSGRNFISLSNMEKISRKKSLKYDKTGDMHYDIISAFHKSLRGSDPDGAIYWLARMLAAGEDPLYIARRMVRFAVEDVGNADPAALNVAINAVETYRFLGSPEGDLALAQAALYLATAPKSNSVYKAYSQVMDVVKKTGSQQVPLHIRNAATKLMKEFGYGKGYQYAHDYKDGFAPEQTYLPEPLAEYRFYEPTQRGYEGIIKKRLEKWRQLKKEARFPKQKGI